MANEPTSEAPHFKLMSLADIKAEDERRQSVGYTYDEANEMEEKAFRRGFYHGWQEAIDTLWELVKTGRLSFADSYRTAWDFWERDIIWWMGEPCPKGFTRDMPHSMDGMHPPELAVKDTRERAKRLRR